MIHIILSERDFDYELQALVNSFFPGQISRVVIEPQQSPDHIRRLAAELAGDGSQPEKGANQKDGPVPEALLIGAELGGTGIRVWTYCRRQLREAQTAVSGQQDFHKHEDKTAHPYRTAYKNKLKGLLFDLLKELEPEQLPEGMELSVPVWGTMTGVRPTKIPMNQLLDGEPAERVYHTMKQEYHCTPEKAKLCIEIARREAELLRQADFENGYSLYVGIPFCPTTCLYCSFPSYPLEQFGKWIPEYIDALEKELRFCGERLQGRRLTSVYVGGGTPTALSAEQLTELLDGIRQSFPVEQAREFTVEAGRPDSITAEKLLALRRAGVDRISVNPQTMQDATLERIGRRHTVAQTGDVFVLARECGFDNINMDLIAGLPGETAEDFADTLRRIGALDPDSVTIHSLVVKRASRLRELLDAAGAVPEQERAKRMEQMLELGQRFAAEHGYQPYYMYRQKNSAGYAGSSGQENIGFARPGKECLYNILIMEEMQSIVAVGAGASTKWYDAKRRIVSRVENVKSVPDYINRIDEMLERKRV